MNTKITKEQVAVLKCLNGAGYTSAIIAGGAVRDSYFKKPINDIDIFIYDVDHDPDQLAIQSSRKAGTILEKLDARIISRIFDIKSGSPRHYSSTNVISTGEDFVAMCYTQFQSLSSGSYGPDNRFITSIINMVKNHQLYQFISVNIDPIEYVTKQFDVNLCKAYCDGTRMRYTQDFLEDARNKTLTINPKLTEEEHYHTMQIHLPRLQTKFPDFRVIHSPPGILGR